MQVIHLKQKHAHNTVYDPKLVAEIAYLQFHMAKQLKALTYLPVVTESLSFDLDEHLRTKTPYYKEITNLFPNGLPTYYDQLTTKQKKCIYDWGAARILYTLGDLPCIYRSVSNEILAEYIEHKITTTDYKDEYYIFDAREEEAIKNVKRAGKLHFQNTNSEPTVLLIFGCGHDFSQLCRQEGIEYRTVNFGVTPEHSRYEALGARSRLTSRDSKRNNASKPAVGHNLTSNEDKNGGLKFKRGFLNTSNDNHYGLYKWSSKQTNKAEDKRTKETPQYCNLKKGFLLK